MRVHIGCGHFDLLEEWGRDYPRMKRLRNRLCNIGLQAAAIDPCHRYGHNLYFYYDIWFDSNSTQPFFYWLDVGHGEEINLESCPKYDLQSQCIKYLGPKERQEYEVIVESGMSVYKQNGTVPNTVEDSKYIFVLSTSRALYVG